MPTASDWNNTWTIDSPTNSSFPFFGNDDTVTTASTPSFSASASGAPSFSSVTLNSAYTQMTASFTYNSRNYNLTVNMVTDGGNNSLSGSISNASVDTGVGNPVATWTTEDGPDPAGTHSS